MHCSIKMTPVDASVECIEKEVYEVLKDNRQKLKPN